MKNVVADIRPFDDPVPPEVGDFDLITFLFFYHDTTYMSVDRAEMNRKLFAALKPGGLLLIADHSALPGQGTTVGKTLHRIEEGTYATKSKRPASASSPRAISGGTQTIRTISQVTDRTCRSIISCTSFRSPCKCESRRRPCGFRLSVPAAGGFGGHRYNRYLLSGILKSTFGPLLTSSAPIMRCMRPPGPWSSCPSSSCPKR